MAMCLIEAAAALLGVTLGWWLRGMVQARRQPADPPGPLLPWSSMRDAWASHLDARGHPDRAAALEKRQ